MPSITLLPQVSLLPGQLNSPDARVKAAHSLLQKRDYAGAILELRRLLDVQRDLVEAHGMRGEALLAQGYSAEAMQQTLPENRRRT